VEGKYWDPVCRCFTAEQWEAKVDEIASIGMKYLVLLDTAIVHDTYAESYFHTDVFPFADISCQDPLGALLNAADRNGMKVFVSCGYYGNCGRPLENMTSPEITDRAFRAMEQLWALYGGHPSFYGWYLPDEVCIEGHFQPEFIRYVNRYSAQARKLAPETKMLIAPYGTNLLSADERYIEQLRELDADIIAYQDEVGVRKSRPEETGAYYQALRRAHDAAGRSALWADVEIFSFEGEAYHSALIPADMERVERQIASIGEFVEEVLCYQYMGLCNRPGTIAYCGHPNSISFYNALAEHNRKYGGV